MHHSFPLRRRVIRPAASTEVALEILPVRVFFILPLQGGMESARVRKSTCRTVASEVAFGEELDLLVTFDIMKV